MGLVVNGTAINDYYPGVNVNGTDMQNVYLNDTKVWTRYPYTPGTEIFTYSWSPSGNIDNFRTTYYQTYPLVFASQPYYTQGGGSADSTLRFELFSGFQVSYYHQDELGNDTDGAGAGNHGGIYNLWLGRTVTGAYGSTFGFSIPGSGNGSSYIIVKYIGN